MDPVAKLLDEAMNLPGTSEAVKKLLGEAKRLHKDNLVEICLSQSTELN